MVGDEVKSVNKSKGNGVYILKVSGATRTIVSQTVTSSGLCVKKYLSGNSIQDGLEPDSEKATGVCCGPLREGGVERKLWRDTLGSKIDST